MFCPNCGAGIPEDGKFCPSCGADLSAAGHSGDRAGPSPNVELCPDGVYRWIYEFSMKKNPMILLTILKIFAFICLGLWVLSVIMDLTDGDPFLQALWSSGRIILPICAVLMLLTVLAYLIVSAVNGGKYIVLFEMDETGVTHTQEPKQFSKAQGLQWLAVMAGAALHDPTLAGAGLMAAARSGIRSEFAGVRSMKAIPRWNTIKLNQPLAKNQVYAEKEDFDFVLSFIRSHVPPETRGR